MQNGQRQPKLLYALPRFICFPRISSWSSKLFKSWSKEICSDRLVELCESFEPAGPPLMKFTARSLANASKLANLNLSITKCNIFGPKKQQVSRFSRFFKHKANGQIAPKRSSSDSKFVPSHSSPESAPKHMGEPKVTQRMDRNNFLASPRKRQRSSGRKKKRSEGEEQLVKH